MKKIDALESLRGILALWVLIGHVVSFTYSTRELEAAHAGIFGQPILAVCVFIILSGFVILYLLDKGSLSYGEFLSRRFFRIFPLYLIVLAVSAATLQWQLKAMQALPWRDQDVLSDIAIHQASIHQFWPQLLAHLALLQGVIPWSRMPYSDYTFLGTAWSISLEWQFYMLAPLLAFLIANRRWHALCGIAAVFLVLRHLNYGTVGFIGNQSGYFLVGIASYFLFKGRVLASLGGSATDALIAGAALALYFFFEVPWPLLVWVVVLATISTGGKGLLARCTTATLGARPLMWLGKISYSIYLVHPLVICAVFAAILRVTASRAEFLLIALPATIAATIAVSALTFAFIESPCMRWGKKRASGASPLSEVSLKTTP